VQCYPQKFDCCYLLILLQKCHGINPYNSSPFLRWHSCNIFFSTVPMATNLCFTSWCKSLMFYVEKSLVVPHLIVTFQVLICMGFEVDLDKVHRRFCKTWIFILLLIMLHSCFSVSVNSTHDTWFCYRNCFILDCWAGRKQGGKNA